MLIQRTASAPALAGMLCAVALADMMQVMTASAQTTPEPTATDQPAPAPSAAPESPRLIVRIDDVGFCHAANIAAERILAEGVCTAVSVIVTTPWLDHAVEILDRHPEVSVGVHLTLNAEWREYRWGPVLGAGQVPSLVDESGRFFPSRAMFFANHPKEDDIRRELTAQVELALKKGLNISYVDYHMGTAMSTPECQRIVEELAARFGLGISQYFGEAYAPNVYRDAPGDKLPAALKIIDGLSEPRLYLYVAHPGTNTPEMAALTDLNPGGLADMAAHRQAETDVLCSRQFREAIARRGLRLTTYEDLRKLGLENMKRPWVAEPYSQEPKAGENRPKRDS